MKKTKRGRRPQSKSGEYHPVTAIRLPYDMKSAVDRWARRQEDNPGRSEAIRRLVEIGLTTAQAKRSRRATAANMASQTIDRLADPAAPPEDRIKRKQRLLKGPKEFRDTAKWRS
jgi:hypothetical protein